jgi:hypothetical protein
MDMGVSDPLEVIGENKRGQFALEGVLSKSLIEPHMNILSKHRSSIVSSEVPVPPQKQLQ